jgi:hypothetical protein
MKRQLLMESPETSATFGTRHKTKTNNTKIMTQKSKKRSNTDLTKNKM